MQPATLAETFEYLGAEQDLRREIESKILAYLRANAKSRPAEVVASVSKKDGVAALRVSEALLGLIDKQTVHLEEGLKVVVAEHSSR